MGAESASASVSSGRVSSGRASASRRVSSGRTFHGSKEFLLRQHMQKAMEHLSAEMAGVDKDLSRNIQLASHLLLLVYADNESNQFNVAKTYVPTNCYLVNILNPAVGDTEMNILIKDAAVKTALKEGFLQFINEIVKKPGYVQPQTWNVAFRHAASVGHVKIVKYLLNIPGLVDVHDVVDEALRKASANGYVVIADLLIKHGANVNVVASEALRSAAANGHIDVVKLLIERGAAENQFAVTQAYNVAKNNKNKDIVKYLEENFSELKKQSITRNTMRNATITVF